MPRVTITISREYTSSHHAQTGLDAMLDKVPSPWEVDNWDIRK
jgi:hypothetical protein